MGARFVPAELKEAKVACGSLRDAVEKSRAAKADSTLAQTFGSKQFRQEQLKSVRPDFSCVRNLTGHTGRVYDLCWSQRSGNALVSVSKDGRIIVWDALSGFKSHAIQPVSPWLMTCAMAPSGGMVASAGLDNVCSLYKLDLDADPYDNLPRHKVLVGHQGYISCCRFVPGDDGKMLTASGDQTCALWDCRTGHRLQSFTSHTSDVMCISTTSSNPNVFVSGSCDASVKIWDLRSPERPASTLFAMYPSSSKAAQIGEVGSPKGTANGADVNSVHLFRDERTVAAGYEDGLSAVFDARSRHCLQRYYPPERPQGPRDAQGNLPSQGVTCLEASSSGRLLFVAYAGHSAECLIWDTLSAKVVGRLGRHTARVSCLGLTADGSALCTGSWDATLKVWAVLPRGDVMTRGSNGAAAG
eukprot:TRINITY_DN1857_c0_g1_i1.p1 TRINITY_DN1857_c0_g1~~TRINITY_DN1857_c0_g1_i1.p1  ORF type:complete len:414 (-),score=42.60 TRINITY_DN1857_c0_g1_i1:1237-2478(-)